MGAAPWVMMLIIIAFYIVLGFFLDAISMILITVPIFLPVAVSAGYDGIWFGILVLLVTEVGLITTPVGLNIFVIRGQIPDVALDNVYRGILPFLWAHAAMIAILMIVPGVALWLPGVLY
jgi:TRAP-type C4-dicarboxylate transport system permease large subunit